METKKYSSYAQIEKELEILKLEREIQYQKTVLCFKKAKENFTPEGIISNLVGSYKSLFSNSYGTLINMALPYVIKWIFKK